MTEPDYSHAAATEPEAGHELLDQLHTAITRYCVLPSAATIDAVVLWVAATHCLPAFDYAPRLVVRSAEKRSGKSRLLEVIDAVSHQPLRVVNASVSYIFRSLGTQHPPTLLIDEADAIFGTKVKAEQNEDLRGLLNAGFQRGLNYGRTVGPTHTPTEFPRSPWRRSPVSAGCPTPSRTGAWWWRCAAANPAKECSPTGGGATNPH